MINDQMKEIAKMMINDCKEEVGASDDDVASLNVKKMPSSHAGLCLVECLFRSADIMKDGRLYKEGAMNILSGVFKDDSEKISKLSSMLDACEKEIGEGGKDSCETAKMVVDCTMKLGSKFGFEFPHHM